MIVVIMPVFNGKSYLEQQIKSILEQLDSGDLILISDDGSTDGTLDIIRSFSSEKLKCYERSKNTNIYCDSYSYTTDNINFLIDKLPECDYVFFADQDDIWLPNKVSLFKSRLSTADCVLSDCSYVNEDLTLMHQSKFDIDGCGLSFFSILKRNPFLGASMAITYNMLKKVAPVPNQVPHDLWIGYMSKHYGTLGLICVSTMLYRRHSSTLTFTSAIADADSFSKNERSIYRKIRSRVLFIFNLVFRLVFNK